MECGSSSSDEVLDIQRRQLIQESRKGLVVKQTSVGTTIRVDPYHNGESQRVVNKQQLPQHQQQQPQQQQHQHRKQHQQPQQHKQQQQQQQPQRASVQQSKSDGKRLQQKQHGVTITEITESNQTTSGDKLIKNGGVHSDVTGSRRQTDDKSKNTISPLIANHKTWKVEDTFWEGKKRVIQDYGRIRDVVDKHAIDTPKYLKDNSDKLVTHLISIARSDLERYRVIFRWIAHHIESDMSHINEEPEIGDDSPETILKNGKGQDISGLFIYLCRKACLECSNVLGKSKGLGYEPAESLDTISRGCGITHITIGGQRFSCSCKWAAGHVDRDKDTGKYKHVRDWTEAWFLADPKTSDASHLPLNSDNSVDVPALQAQRSYATYADWNHEPTKKPAYFIYKMQCVSHTHGLIETDNNEVVIRLKCFYPMDIFTTMKIAKVGDAKPLDLPKDREYDRCVARSFQGDEVVVNVRLPEKGDYIVGILGYPHRVNDEVTNASGSFIVGYRVRGLSNTPCLLFPERKGDIYGANWDLQLAGVHVVQPANPIMKSEEGKAVIELDRGECEKDMIFELYHESDPSVDLNEFMYPETVGNKVKLNISCPKAGTYACAMYCKFDDSDETYNVAGQFVIECPEPDLDARPLPSNSTGLWGPDGFINNLGIKLSESMKTSTIHTIYGEANIEFLVPKGIKTSHNLVSTNGENIGETRLYAETKSRENGDREVNLKIRCTDVGNYRLDLFGNVDSESSMTFCGRWLVICSEPYRGDVFPESNGLWGPNRFIHQLGIQFSESMTTSTVHTIYGEANIEFLVPKGIKTSHNLVTATDENIGETHLYAETKSRENGDREVNLKVRCTEVGNYRLDLFGDVDSESSMKFCGRWLVICNEPYRGDVFPESHGLWGPNGFIHQLGIQFSESMTTSTIHTIYGEANIEFLVPKGIKTSHNLVSTNGENIGDTRLYAETKSRENGDRGVNLKIRCTEVGNYRLDLFGDVDSESSMTFCGRWLVICNEPYRGDVFPESRGLWGPNGFIHQLGIKLSESMTTSTVHTIYGEANIEFLVPKGIKTSHNLVTATDENIGETHLYAETKGRRNGDRDVNLEIRCIEAGNYRLDLFGNVDSESSMKFCGRWLVICNEPYRGDVFPESHGLWGPNLHSKNVGVEVIYPTSSTIQTHDGEARLIIYLDMKYYLANKYIHGLFHNNKRVENEKECVYAMVNYHEGTFVNVTYNIKLTKKGYHKFILWGDPKSCSTFKETGQWLIRCKMPFYSQLFPQLDGLIGNAARDGTSAEGVSLTCSTPEDFRKKGKRLISCEGPFIGELFPEQHGVWGANSHCREMGLEVVSPLSSSLTTSEGHAQLVVRIKQKDFHANTFTHGLFKDDARLKNNTVMAEVMCKQGMIEITYNMKLSKKGYYKFKIWGDSKTCKTYPEAGVWLMNCIQPCHEADIYPEHWKPWGPDEKFRDLGLSVKDHDCSTIQAVDGECSLTIVSQQSIHTAFDLKTADGKEINTVSSKRNETGTSTVFTIKVPQTGYYSFDLYASKTSGSMPLVGKWLVVMAKRNDEELIDDVEEQVIMDDDNEQQKVQNKDEEQVIGNEVKNEVKDEMNTEQMIDSNTEAPIQNNDAEQKIENNDEKQKIEKNKEEQKMENNDEEQKMENSDEEQKMENNDEEQKMENNDEEQKMENRDQEQKMENNDQEQNMENNDQEQQMENNDEEQKIENRDQEQKMENNDQEQNMENHYQEQKMENSDQEQKMENRDQEQKMENNDQEQKIENNDQEQNIENNDETQKME